MGGGGNGGRATDRERMGRRQEGGGEEAMPELNRTEGQAIDGHPLGCSTVKPFF